PTRRSSDLSQLMSTRPSSHIRHDDPCILCCGLAAPVSLHAVSSPRVQVALLGPSPVGPVGLS
ncbi:MAG: hypothetical protein PHW87_13990, partial [Methanothrix sp.]|nr:hypothetical protein [Methanothrix sp.]